MSQNLLSASLGAPSRDLAKRSLAFLRPQILFGATFHKGFYKAFDTLPFSRILAFKPDPASNEAFLKGSVKQDASNQLQLQVKPFLKDL